ncbi:MAG: RNA-binding S4 domain-containing protein [Corynebacterium sp.]|nr:RNA-binding S4 domain-containing protein [Corynebacterium sp.]
MQTFDVNVTKQPIKLGQFLKLANLVETGGLAKQYIAEGEVYVNDAVETRRGYTLREHDVVRVGDLAARVTFDAEDDYFDEATADDDFDPEVWRNM